MIYISDKYNGLESIRVDDEKHIQLEISYKDPILPIRTLADHNTIFIHLTDVEFYMLLNEMQILECVIRERSEKHVTYDDEEVY